MSIFTLVLSPVLDWWLFPCESLPYTLLFTDIRTWVSICLTTVFAFVWNLVFFDYSSLVSPLTYQFTNLVKQLVQTLLGIWSNPGDANLEVYLSTLFKAIGGSMYIVSKSYEKARKKKGALLSPLLPDVEVGTDICSICSTSSVSTEEQEISDLPSQMICEIETIARLESGLFPIEDASPQSLKLAPSEASTMTAEDRVPSNISVCSLERSAEFQ
ncbi:MAG: uncharacterized protein KVP18_003469 [Porospora cf. gigantea A]|nr:MAG: hypothetical protein KVP18_003469 [Porospora cf. gigantea A]